MTTTRMTARTARVQAGEAGAIILPRVINGSDRYGLVACHGAGGTWSQMVADSGWPTLSKMTRLAARNGIPVISEHLGGDTFGNSTSRTRVDTCRTVLATQSGCSNAKIHLLGASMGAAVALEYGINNPTRVASMTLLIPLTSIVNAHKTNPPTGTEANAAGNLTAAMATAWGTTYRTVTDAVTNGTTTLTSATAAFTGADVGRILVSKTANGIPAGTTIASVTNGTTVVMSAAASTSGTGRIVGIAAPLPAGADILANAASLSGIPIRLYYAPDDTLIVPADVTALATAIGSSATATATSGGGHANTGLVPGGFDYDEWVEWLIENGG